MTCGYTVTLAAAGPQRRGRTRCATVLRPRLKARLRDSESLSLRAIMGSSAAPKSERARAQKSKQEKSGSVWEEGEGGVREAARPLYSLYKKYGVWPSESSGGLVGCPRVAGPGRAPC